MKFAIPRVPWPGNFPSVVIHGDLSARNNHPNLSIAKAGNADAALALARDLLDDSAIDNGGPALLNGSMRHRQGLRHAAT